MLKRQIRFGAITVLLAACTADKPEPTGFEVRAPLFAVGANSGGDLDMNLGTHLTGDEEVFTPAAGSTATPADSRAQGQAIFRVNSNGTVDYRLIASNIDNVAQAHIHCGRPGSNGPISIWLYPENGPPAGPNGSGPQNGVLATGTFNPTGAMCLATNVGSDMPVLNAIRAGLAYVNVHTNDGVGAANTGPGDFPGGEIRGQLGDKNN